jgi:hypothetical protein
VEDRLLIDSELFAVEVYAIFEAIVPVPAGPIDFDVLGGDLEEVEDPAGIVPANNGVSVPVG